MFKKIEKLINKEEEEIPYELLDLSSYEKMEKGNEKELDEEKEEYDDEVGLQLSKGDNIDPLTSKALRDLILSSSSPTALGHSILSYSFLA